MSSNDMTNASEKKSLFTIKNTLRALSLFGIIFVFCPAFVVSCSGQNVNVSAFNSISGLSAYGEEITDPYPIMLVSLIVPAVILILLLVNKYADKKKAAIIVGCTVVDMIIWFIFRAAVKKIAAENFCGFKTTGWFVINIIAMTVIIFLSAGVVLAKLEMDTDLIRVFSSGGTQAIGKAVHKENVIGFCAKCGNSITNGCRFCESCGTAVPESMLAEAAKAEQDLRDEIESPGFCRHCGAKLAEDAVFCEACGTKADLHLSTVDNNEAGG